jgi:hypothetical protein
MCSATVCVFVCFASWVEPRAGGLIYATRALRLLACDRSYGRTLVVLDSAPSLDPRCASLPPRRCAADGDCSVLAFQPLLCLKHCPSARPLGQPASGATLLHSFCTQPYRLAQLLRPLVFYTVWALLGLFDFLLPVTWRERKLQRLQSVFGYRRYHVVLSLLTCTLQLPCAVPAPVNLLVPLFVL